MQALVFLLFVAVINMGVCQKCAQDWQHFQGHCYGYADTTVSWGNAQAICQSKGGTLAESPTLAVNTFLSTMAKHKGDFCVWLGGSDIFHEGNWEWSSGRYAFSSFTNWRGDQPNSHSNDEDCLNMHQPEYNWHDDLCNNNCNFICEAPVGARG